MIKIKTLFSVLLCLALCFSFCSCKNDTDIPNGMKEIVSEYTDYRLFIPAEWTEDTTTGFVSAKYNDKSNISVQALSATIYQAGDGYAISANNVIYNGVDDYFKKSYFPSLSSTVKDVVLEEEYTQNQSFGGDTRACKYVYTIMSDGISYRIMQIFTPHNAALYIFTYTSTVDNYSSHLEDVDSIVKNFIFK